MDWFLKALKKYATFSGRAQRAEYWYFTLFYVLLLMCASVVDMVTGLYHAETETGLFGSVVLLGLLIPAIAVGVRRLHDTGRSGWWMLLWLVPLIGFIAWLVWTLQDSTPGANEYGPNLKEIPI
ncbi:DUF805 domain-containing protein [Comamonas terrigena]|uniref:DUF805 domain-containing protein n=1 Tax=Comamonas terrigena TaxID=32013 RepID=UPI0024468845|nr:DUF805 domain-containing protein [Comamonas terrigena]MDH1701682.1 DUF805 domain-containing protein [Comamonas terrigena]